MPGQGFSFVVHQVPAKMAELSLDQLLSALDLDGLLHQQAKNGVMVLQDEEITSLEGVATTNVCRTEKWHHD
jgi:hypothetical protein